MTKTTHTTTVEPTSHPEGGRGWRITCTCTTHPDGANSAIVRDSGAPFARRLVHGTVLMAHHPAKPIRVSAQRRGIWAA